MGRQEIGGLRWIVAFLDPAGGRSKNTQASKRNAQSAYAVVGRGGRGETFCLESWGGRCPTEELVEKVFDVNARWKPRQFGVEANAMQSLFGDSLAIIAKSRGVRLPLVEVYQPTRVDKDFRIRTTLQPLLAEGSLFVSPDQVELLGEMRAFPTGRLKDMVDALASACAMLPLVKQHDPVGDEERAYREFLEEQDEDFWLNGEVTLPRV